MEYSFRISSEKKLTTIHLDDYSFTLHTGEAEEIISYASIISVRINRYSGGLFRIFIEVDGHQKVIVPNLTYSEGGEKENQSGAYSLFVRVLHRHLKDKSSACFKAGKSMDRIWRWVIISALVSFMISLAADYLGVGLMNPYIQSSILFVLSAIVIFVFSINKLPKTYHPSNIPHQFLP